MTPVRIIQAASLLLLALFAFANLAGIEKLWGINFFKFFDHPLSFVALLSCLVLFFPAISKGAADALNEFGRNLLQIRQLRFLCFGFISLAAITLFLKFSSAATLLGDGSLRINQVESGRWWLATEPFDFFLHASLYRFIFHPLRLNAEWCYRIISALSGVLFLFGAFKLAVHINPQKWPLGFLVMASSGIMVLFFGYIESYSPAAALIPFLFLAGLKSIDGSGSKAQFLILFVIAAMFHLVIALIFSFSVLYMYFIVKSAGQNTNRQVSRPLILLISVVIVILYAARYAGVGNLERFVLGLLPTSGNPQSILSQNHWLNILNWILIAALPALILSPALLKQKSGDETSLAKQQFAIWCIIPALVFILVFTPQLGGPRDWDLFSLPALLLLISTLTLFHLKTPGGLPHQILPAIAISIWIIVAFVGVNTSTARSAQRQEEIIEVSRFKNHYKDYANLLHNVEKETELRGKRIEYARKAWNEPPLTKGDSVYILNRLSELTLEQNDKISAQDYLNLAVKADSNNAYGHLLRLSYSNQFESLEKVLENARLIEMRFPDNPEALSALGVVYSQADSGKKALSLYERAFQLDSARFDIIQNYAILLYQSSQTERGLDLLRRAYKIGPDSFLVNYHLSAVHHQAGNIDSSRYYYGKVNAMASKFQEQQLLYNLNVIINDSTKEKE